MIRTCVLAALMTLNLLAAPSVVRAQLLSPGRLAQAHAELEGLRNCTSCHELGARGISPERCLNCHQELESRIEANRGYHAAVARTDCAECHQDHLGTGFDLRHLDETTFDHLEAGYELRLSHGSLECRDCHQASLVDDPIVVALMTERRALGRTFLGLSTDCVRCHATDSPHDDQFAGQACSDCHDEGEWASPPNFDHVGARFPLEGRHVEVACSNCHGSGEEAVYTPIAFARCDDCHTDPHAGAMGGGACTTCHSTAGWTEIASESVERVFNHSTTRFALAGAHATLQCRACHQPGRPPRNALLRMTYTTGTQSSAYPRPLFDACRACHVQQHRTTTGDVRWTDCEACHSDARWSPSPFDVARHAESNFPLTGSHLVTPCVACHQNPARDHEVFTLELADQQCVDCHEVDNPHEGTYTGMPCEQCHVTEAFDAVQFDHDLALDVLDPPTCSSCHAQDDPHQGQFEDRDCAACHTAAAEDFTVEAFDHNTTRFPLDGAHDDVECATCHAVEPGLEPLVRYRPLGIECVDCHAGL